MSFIGRLFGSPEATREMVSTVKDGLDALWYTDQEKAESDRADTKEARFVFLDWIKNSQGQNLSRRLLAFMITSTWLFFKVVGFILNTIAVWSGSNAEKLKVSAEMAIELSSDMTGAVMLIIGFYFAAPHMGKIATAALSRFGKDNTKEKQ